jgi:hypothetical protein
MGKDHSMFNVQCSMFDVPRFMGSFDLQQWTRIGTMNRRHVAQPSRLRVTAASRRRFMERWCSGLKGNHVFYRAPRRLRSLKNHCITAILILTSERGHSCPQQRGSVRQASRFAAIAADKNVRAPSK